MRAEQNSIGVSILAGSLSGASETVVTVSIACGLPSYMSQSSVLQYPAEFVKTRRQLSCHTIGERPPGSFAILRATFRTAGIQGIYSGCQTLALSNALKSGVRFVSFEAAKRNLNKIFDLNATSGTNCNNPWISLGAGLCAGVTESILVVTPGEYIKTVVIHDASLGGRLGHQSLFKITRHTIHQNGVLSLWRGVVPVVCKQGTNSAVRFTTFGALRDKIRQTWPENLSESASTFIAGAGSGVVTV